MRSGTAATELSGKNWSVTAVECQKYAQEGNKREQRLHRPELGAHLSVVVGDSSDVSVPVGDDSVFPPEAGLGDDVMGD